MKRTLSIQFRIVFGLALILILSIGLSIFLTSANQKANLLDASQRTLAVNNEMLNATIRNIMLSGEAPIANRTIEDFRNISGFLEFELYRVDGTTAFNDFETLEFVNDYQDQITFDQTPRLGQKSIDSEAFNKVLKNNAPVVVRNDEARELEYYFPILNYADCRACHGTEEFIRGVSHFRISLQGIFDQVQRASTILTVYFVTVGLAIFAWIFFLMRRTIILPVLKIGDTVNIAATGNLDVQVDMNRNDEVGELASRVNSMISGLREGRDLELQNRVYETRLEENRKYLDNIKEGLLLLNSERRITSQYSMYLTQLFGRDDFAGISLSEFIYPNEERDTDKRKELDSFLEMVFTNVTADMEMIMSINPLEQATLTVTDGREIIIRADFLRIYSNEELENVMVIFEDQTDIVHTQHELEDQRLRRESELEQISAVLKLGPQTFEGFIDEAEKASADLRENLTNLGDSTYIASAFRNIHSVKGTARYLDIPKVEEYSHALEGLLAEVRNGNHPANKETENAVADILENLDKEINEVTRLIDRFRDFAVRGSGTPASPMNVFEERLEGMVQDISGQLEKEVAFSLETELKDIPRLGELQASIFHLIRNALDHGLEDSFERLSSGKESEGSLSLRILEENGWLSVEVEDDGRGLDLKALERRGVEYGLLKPGKHLPSQIVNILFKPGFSARDEATDISGRGVGLDAVKEDIKALGGRINVRTNPGKGSTFILSIPLNKDNS